MANMCVNWVNLVLDPQHENYKRFKKASELLENKSKLFGIKNQGVFIMSEPVFDLGINEGNSDSPESMSIRCETKWSTCELDDIKKLMELFPCITEFEMEFEECSSDYYGIIKADRLNTGEINITEVDAPEVFLDATKMRDKSFDERFKSVKDASVRCEISIERIEAVLNKTEIKLEEFSSDLCIFDLSEFIK